MDKLIGIAGPARSGKDTFASLLLENGIRAHIISLALPIKNMAKVLGLTEAQLYGDLKEEIDPRFNTSPRKILQTLGTEWGRELIDEDIWLNIIKNSYDGNIIIPDIRFQNEADFVREHGVLIHISRDGININSDHSSEGGVNHLMKDFYVANNAQVSDLESKALSIAKYLNADWR